VGYNWHPFTLGGQHFLAHADNVVPSTLFRWDGDSFVEHQELADRHGRAFADFEADGEHFLLVARLQSESELLRWDGERFLPHQKLAEPGGREFAVIRGEQGLYVSPSELCPWHPGRPGDCPDLAALSVGARRADRGGGVPDTGGTDVAVFHDAAGPLVG